MIKKILQMITAGLVLALLGCSTIPSAPPLEKNANTATVYFFMGAETIYLIGSPRAAVFTLWDSDTFISNIRRGQYLAANFQAGTHYFMSSDNTGSHAGALGQSEWNTSKIELEPGKTYFYYLKPQSGSLPYATFHIMKPNDPEIDNILRSYNEITPMGKTTKGVAKQATKHLKIAKENLEANFFAYNVGVVPPGMGR